MICALHSSSSGTYSIIAPMRFYSTRDSSIQASFETALLDGIAPDGGLYYPSHIPKLPSHISTNIQGASLGEVAKTVLTRWLHDEMEESDIESIVSKSLDYPISLVQVGDYHVMELFHGPTMAFKDVAAGLLAGFMDHFLAKRNRRATVLVATSGDTGGAVAQGFAGLSHVHVVILYPKGKVSALQQEQLTRVANNVSTIEVDGVFDDCQAHVKKAFGDNDLKHLNLTSANSINIGRLIPQSVYYVYARSRFPKEIIQFVIPSGNMGNITAGLFAQAMGVLCETFIVANNGNDPVADYYRTGIYMPRPSVKTLSNAMDIGAPSNFERVMTFVDSNHETFKEYVHAVTIDEQTTIQTIQSVYHRHNYLLDPHTAVAWAAAERTRTKNALRIIVSTASPIKFAHEIYQATSITIDDSQEIIRLQQRPQRVVCVENTYEAVKNAIIGACR